MKKDDDTEKNDRPRTLDEYIAQWEKEGLTKRVQPPKGRAVVVFPGPHGKVDMIDAAHRLYGIKRDDGDVVIRIRNGRVV